MIHILETVEDVAAGLQHLERADPRLGPAIAQSGPLPLRRREPGLEGLLSIIVAQQLSVASADAIWARVKQRFAPFNAANLLSANEEAFRACGLSAPKIRTLKSISSAIIDGELPLDQLHCFEADAAHAAMTRVKGIGPWTADIYLMFGLGHADAFASGDLALQEALRLVYGLEARPNAKQLQDYAEAWRPWRSVAARLLWAYYKVVKSREGIGGTS